MDRSNIPAGFQDPATKALLKSICSHPRDFTTGDLRRRPELVAVADFIVRTYEGSNGFMLDLRRELLDGRARRISIYQQRAALNFVRATSQLTDGWIGGGE